MNIEDVVIVINEEYIYGVFHKIKGFTSILKNPQVIDYFTKNNEEYLFIPNETICYIREILTVDDQNKIYHNAFEDNLKYVIQDLEGNYAIIKYAGVGKLTEANKKNLIKDIFIGKK